MSSITELAFTAEIARAQPSIVTQIRRPDKQNDLSAGALFFDGDSRNVAEAENGEDNRAAARDLNVQSQLMKMLNDFQTRGTSGGGGTSRQSFAPPDVPPKLFVLPKEQEMAPHVTVPQPRGDLEALMRLGIDQFCSALGIPASLVFEGRYSQNNATQLQLLNSTVSQLAKSVNQVLTKTYLALYGEDGDGEEPPQLRLQTAPLAASEEVERLYNGQLIDLEVALPAAMHALGATTDEVEAALERAKTKEAEKCACEKEEQEWQKKDRDVNLKERAVNLEATKANTEKTKKEAAGLVKKPEAGAAGGGSDGTK